MRDLESLAQGNCRSYAQDPTFQYHCNGFPICGINEWWTVSGTQTNQDAYNACMTFLQAGVARAAQTPQKRRQLLGRYLGGH